MATDLFLKILLKLKQFENFRQRVVPFPHTENLKKSIHLWRDLTKVISTVLPNSEDDTSNIMLEDNPRGEQESRLYRTNLSFVHTLT